VIALDRQHWNPRLLQRVQRDLCLIERSGLDIAMLKQITRNDHEIDLGGDRILFQRIVKGIEKILGSLFAVVAIEPEMDIG
jgi:hypothetical protein